MPVVEEAAHHPTAGADHVNRMIELLQKSGVIFPGGRKMLLENLRPISSAGFLHAEGQTKQNGENIRVAISFGPRYGPVTARQVDEAIRSSYRLGFDVLVLAGMVFDPEAQATLQKNPIPRLEVHLANISPDVVVGEYGEQPLLRTTKASQLFTVFGQPDVTVEKTAEGFVVKLLGVDIYDPETGEVHSSSADAVPAWFLDEDYDGYTFRISQAFFPKGGTAKNAWDKLEKALHGTLDKVKMEVFRGTESLPFRAGPEKRIAVKLIDNRGNEVMVVKSLGNRKE
jgi:adenine-specific DNA-methyltransferase